MWSDIHYAKLIKLQDDKEIEKSLKIFFEIGMALIVSTIMLISVDISKFIIENVIFGTNLIKDCVNGCK